MAELSTQEIKELQDKAKLSIIKTIINESEKFVYYEEKLNKNLLDGEKLVNRIVEIERNIVISQ